MKKNNSNPTKIAAVSLSALILLGYISPRPVSATDLGKWDINKDGKVNNLDLSELSLSYNSKTGDKNFNNLYDFNTDGIIDIYDLVSLANNFTISTDTTAPGEFQITKNNWDGSPDYTISMNLWYGTNGDLWRIYENDILIAEVPLVNNSPLAQTAEYKFTDKPNGTYEYRCELVNAIGVTQAKTTVIHEVTKNEKPIDIELPSSASGEPAVGYKVLRENDKTFEWAVYIANPNKSYIWEGKEFSAWGLTFQTDHEITSVSNCSSYSQIGNTVTINLKQDERLLPYDTTRVFVVKGNKKGLTKPESFKSNLVRGNIAYPKYQGLPDSWSKNKTDLSIDDLIANKTEYYNPSVKANTGNMLMYENPAHPTQMQIGLPKEMPVKVNGVSGLRIWIPSDYLAMGLATGTEFFGLNPNFMVGLSIKENFTCGLVPLEAGYNENLTEHDGEMWSWPIQKTHPDGPFQQEKGNFNEIKKQYPDYLPDSAQHENYVTLKTGNPDDPSYVHAALSSYMSLTMTRELLYAIPNNKFDEFIKESKDPWAEFVLVDNAYNRGVYGLLQRNLFTTHREQAINTTDINKEFNLSGFANHIENIKNIICEMDKETENIYDTEISWEEFENYLTQLRLYYGRGIPSDAEWTDMTNDVKRAFDLLAEHWGGDTISFRYDFLTLLRVAEKYLPKNKQPAPSSASWIEQINSANNQAAAAPQS